MSFGKYAYENIISFLGSFTKDPEFIFSSVCFSFLLFIYWYKDHLPKNILFNICAAILSFIAATWFFDMFPESSINLFSALIIFCILQTLYFIKRGFDEIFKSDAAKKTYEAKRNKNFKKTRLRLVRRTGNTFHTGTNKIFHRHKKQTLNY